MSGTQLTDLFHQGGLEQVRVIPRGLFSTPFAEVILHPVPMARLLAGPLCRIDAVLEMGLRSVMRFVSWNLIAVGRKPQHPESPGQ